MTELFTHYEQQFGNISAEITAKICKIPNLHGCEFNCEFDNLLKLTRVVASFKLKTALFYFSFSIEEGCSQRRRTML